MFRRRPRPHKPTKNDIIQTMRIYTYGETPPQIPDQPEQEPISFEAEPPYINDPSMPEKILTQKDKFPLVDDFELVIIDGRQNPPEKNLGSDVMAQFVNRATNQRITYWDMYYLDTRPVDMNRIPNPAPGELIDEMEMGYHILMTTDNKFVYIVFVHDEDVEAFTHYCKIPKDRYEAEWKAFIDWYHAHPEKRHPHPTPEERRAHSARNDDGSLKKQDNWLSRLFK